MSNAKKIGAAKTSFAVHFVHFASSAFDWFTTPVSLRSHDFGVTLV